MFFVLGEFWSFYAELRRELKWGNWGLLFFEVLLGVPRGLIEEGGQFVFFCVNWRNLIVCWVVVGGYGTRRVGARGVSYLLGYNKAGARGLLEVQPSGRGFCLRYNRLGEGFA
jgi:hypothetical protein